MGTASGGAAAPRAVARCPICAGAARTIWREGPYRARRCADCAHVHSSGGSAAAVYEDEYFERWYLAHRERRLAFFETLLADHALELREPLLDIGAGVGFWLEVCAQHGVRAAAAVEPSRFGRARLAELAETTLPGLAIHADLSALAGRAGAFATLTLLDVLSHVDGLRETLGTAHHLLAPGGQLILKAPNHPAALFRAARWLAPIGRGRALLSVRSQQHHFAAASLPGLMARLGFRTLALRAIGEPRVPLGRDPRSWALNRLTRLAVGPESLLWIGTPVAASS